MERFPLRALRLRPGEELREAVTIPIEPFVLGGQKYAPIAPALDATLVIQRAVSGDVFNLRFSTEFTGPCMRCLADAALTLDVDAQEYQDSDPEADPELQTDYVVAGDLLVYDWARDQALLAFPAQVLCRPGCLGLCPVCGVDRNVDPHEHDEVGIDPRWAALEQLRAGAGPGDQPPPAV